MLRDNLVGLIEPMQISAGVDPLALSILKQASDDRSSCLENPRPEGAESSLTENVTSPFQAEPAHRQFGHSTNFRDYLSSGAGAPRGRGCISPFSPREARPGTQQKRPVTLLISNRNH